MKPPCRRWVLSVGLGSATVSRQVGDGPVTVTPELLLENRRMKQPERC